MSDPGSPRGAASLVLLMAGLTAACGERPPADTPTAELAAPSSDADEIPLRPEQLASPSPDSLVEIGIDLYYRVGADTAKGIFTAALERSRALGDVDAEVRSLTWLSLAGRLLGPLTEARARGEQAVSRAIEVGLRERLSRAYNAVGMVAWYQGRLAEATSLFERASEAARAVGDQQGIARAAANRAQIAAEAGEFAAAREGFAAFREAARALGNARWEADALTNLAMIEVDVGDPREAISRLEEARRLYREAGAAPREENAVSQLGMAYLKLGELGRAHAKFDTALSLARAQGLRSEEAAELETLAETYRVAGHPTRALQLYREASEIYGELGMPLERGGDLRSEAEIYATLGDVEVAMDRATEAFELHGEGGSRFEALLDRIVLAEVAHLRNRREEANAHLAAARRLAGELEARAARVQVTLAEARLADAEGDATRVLASLGPMMGDLSRGDYASEWESEALRARAFLRLGRLDSAIVAGRRAVATVERVRRSLGSGVLRTTYGTSRGRTYADLVTILLRAGRPGEAFQVADAARGVGLREHVAAARQAVALDATASGMAEGEVLLRRVEQLTRSLDELDTTPPEERDEDFRQGARALSVRLNAARREYEAHLVRVAEGSPRSVALLGVATVSVERVQAALRPEEALLEYLVLPDRLLLFVLTADELRVAEAAVSAENLTSRVRLVSGLLRDPESADRAAAGRVLSRLHEVLLEPVVRTGALGGITRLVVVPHGVLTYLPIAALRDPVTGRYVAQDYSVLYLPSASALTLRGAGGVGGGRTLAIGERRGRLPAAAARQVLAFAPFPRELPASEKEVRALAAAFPSSVTTGHRATERRVRRALGQVAAVHVASHGIMNARNPMFSRVELAAGEGAVDDDGRLEVHEILGLVVRAPLVFLSGCETGRGTAWSTEFEQGEDYATLDRAFLYAGAGAVVATLWRVEDEGAAAFAKRFYEEVQSGSAAEALATAQRRMLGNREWSSPFYWAAYRVSGLEG